MSGAAETDSDVEARLQRYVLYDEVNAPYLRWQLEQFMPFLGRRVMEVGVGVGAIVAQLGDRDLVIAVDIEPPMVEFTRKRFAGRPNHEFATLDISALPDATRRELRGKSLDSIVCINVLEHIEDDGAAVATMADLLVPGGVVALLVPAHPSLYGPYDKVEAHFRRYTKSSLRKVIEGAGLAVERLYYFNAIGAPGWWWQYKVMKRDHQTQSDYKLMELLVPPMRAVEKVIKPPFGMSVVTVARKK
ncbi:MAG: class I SAM-dependent methyltransferase [Candidatus Dormibacteraceae bacterium]